LIPATIASGGDARRDLLFVWQTMRARRRRFPLSLLPPRAYVRWRLETACGDGDSFPSAAELLTMARWARRMAEAPGETSPGTEQRP
jgi:hypothetical protein